MRARHRRHRTSSATISTGTCAPSVQLFFHFDADFGKYYYRAQRSWAKVMFLQASVILLTGGCLPQCMLGYPLPRSRHPPRARHPPLEQTPQTRHPPDQTPPRTRQPPPPGSRLRHTVNERPARILLECILVPNIIPNPPGLAPSSGKSWIRDFINKLYIYFEMR